MAIEGISEQIQESTNEISQGLNQVNASIANAAAKIEGITEKENQPSEVIVSELPEFVRDLYEQVVAITDNMQTTEEVLDDIRNLQQENLSISSEGSEQSADSAFIGNTLNEIFNGNSLLLDSLSQILESVNNISIEQQASEGATGPSLAFEDEGWRALAETMSIFASSIQGMDNDSIEAGMDSLASISEFIDTAADLFSADIDAEGATRLNNLLDTIQESYQKANELSAIASTGLESIESINEFLTATEGLSNFSGMDITEALNYSESLKMIFESVFDASTVLSNNLTEISGSEEGIAALQEFLSGTEDLVSSDWTTLSSQGQELATFAQDIQQSLSSLHEAAAVASTISNVITPAIAGLDAAQSFMEQASDIGDITLDSTTYNDINNIFQALGETLQTASTLQSAIPSAMESISEVSTFLNNLNEIGEIDNTQVLDSLSETGQSLIAALASFNEITNISEELTGNISNLTEMIDGINESLSQVTTIEETASEISAGIGAIEAIGVELSSSLTSFNQALSVMEGIETSESTAQITQIIDIFNILSQFSDNVDSALEGIGGLAGVGGSLQESIVAIQSTLQNISEIDSPDTGPLTDLFASFEELGSSVDDAMNSISLISTTSNAFNDSMGAISETLVVAGEIANMISENAGALEMGESLSTFFNSFSSVGATLEGFTDDAENIMTASSVVSSMLNSIQSSIEMSNALSDMEDNTDDIRERLVGLFEMISDTEISELVNNIADTGFAADIGSVSNVFDKIINIYSLMEGMGAAGDEVDVDGVSGSINNLLGSIGNIIDNIDNLTGDQMTVIEGLSEVIATVDQIMDLGSKFSGMEDMDTDMSGIIETADQISSLTESLGNLGNIDNLDSARETLEGLKPLLNELSSLSFEGDFAAGIEGLTEPLMQLDEPISKLMELNNTVKDLNSSLRELSGENKDTFQSLNMNEGEGDSVLSGRGEQFGEDTSVDAEEKQANPQLERIYEVLLRIAGDMEKEERDSWADKEKTERYL